MDNKIEYNLRCAFAQNAGDLEKRISVSTLCEKAHISRASFYLYYKDIDDFYNKSRDYIIEKTFEQFMAVAESAISGDDVKFIFSENDRDLFKIFTQKNVYLDFAASAYNIMSKKFENLMISKLGEEFYKTNETAFEFFLSGGIATLWFDLVDYDEKNFKKDMIYMASLIKSLSP